MAMKTQDDMGVIDKEDVSKSPPPKMFNVVLIDDDFTPMTFVTTVLTDIFNKRVEQAITIMLEVHHKKKGVAGTYTKDVAATKQELAMERARKEGHPLQITIEPK